MKEILLTQNKVALVDDEDYEHLNQFKWFLLTAHGLSYAIRKLPKQNGRQFSTLMHRFLLNPSNNLQVDHINGDGLDNRRENLRICTHNGNQHNSRKITGTSQYKGVHWNKRNKRWYAQIQINGQRHYLGSFIKEIDAALKYDEAAVKYFGEFARTNKILALL